VVRATPPGPEEPPFSISTTPGTISEVFAFRVEAQKQIKDADANGEEAENWKKHRGTHGNLLTMFLGVT
jgi:hypothetical protein